LPPFVRGARCGPITWTSNSKTAAAFRTTQLTVANSYRFGGVVENN